MGQNLSYLCIIISANMEAIITVTTTKGSVMLPPLHAFVEGVEIDHDCVYVYADGSDTELFFSRAEYYGVWEGVMFNASHAEGAWQEMPSATPIGWLRIDECPVYYRLSPVPNNEGEYDEWYLSKR